MWLRPRRSTRKTERGEGGSPWSLGVVRQRQGPPRPHRRARATARVPTGGAQIDKRQLGFLRSRASRGGREDQIDQDMAVDHLEAGW
jgi:hypothetical protein